MIKKVAYITDLHLDEPFPVEKGVNSQRNWETILQDVISRDIQEVIFGGDIGENKSIEWFFDSLWNIDLKVVLGNHDSFIEVDKYYQNEYQGNHKELYYAYEANYHKYIFLDSSSYSIGSTQFQWLINELKTDKTLVIFIHHPILEVNTEVDKQFPLENRDELKLELQKIDNEITIFCGHYHMLDETTDGNLKQIITPASSYQVVKEATPIKVTSETFGYRVIEFTSDKINSELILFTN